jgi:hypothetical protein
MGFCRTLSSGNAFVTWSRTLISNIYFQWFCYNEWSFRSSNLHRFPRSFPPSASTWSSLCAISRHWWSIPVKQIVMDKSMEEINPVMVDEHVAEKRCTMISNCCARISAWTRTRWSTNFSTLFVLELAILLSKEELGHPDSYLDGLCNVMKSLPDIFPRPQHDRFDIRRW